MSRGEWTESLWMMSERRDMLLFVLALSVTLYSAAAVTHAWFLLPPHSFYGLWSVRSCDFLRCQMITAVFSDAPAWYAVVQLLSLVAWLSVGVAFVLMMMMSQSGRRWKTVLPPPISINPQIAASALCLLSAVAIFLSLSVFYGKLCQSSDVRPTISWSSLLAALSGFGALLVGLVLLRSPPS